MSWRLEWSAVRYKARSSPSRGMHDEGAYDDYADYADLDSGHYYYHHHHHHKHDQHYHHTTSAGSGSGGGSGGSSTAIPVVTTNGRVSPRHVD